MEVRKSESCFPAVYIPQRGDIIWLDFDPTLGSEQSGRRPALVLTSFDYNVRSGLCVVCPITSKAKGYPFEVPLPDDCPISGVCLADHIKSQDLRVRNPSKAASLTEQGLRPVYKKIAGLLFG